MLSDRERLIELILQGENEADKKGIANCQMYNLEKAKILADYLLANGVIVPQNKGYAIVILTAISALADMVNQFGYSTTFRKKEAVCDGGLSALENAFWALDYCGCKLNSNGTISLKNLFEFQEKIEKERDKYDL